MTIFPDAFDASTENIDTDEYLSKEDAIQAAIDTSEIGDRVVICRGEWNDCGDGEICEFCARITVTPGLTASAALAMARKQ